MTALDQWVSIIERVARELLGEPNKRLSNGKELRFGPVAEHLGPIPFGR